MATTVRQSFLRGRFRYQRRLGPDRIPIGVRCLMGPDDADTWSTDLALMMGDYEWKPSGPKDFVLGAMSEAIEYDCAPAAGAPFEVTVSDWDQTLVDQLNAFQAAGQRLRLFAVAEDWVVGYISVPIVRKSQVQLKFMFRPMRGCRLIEGLDPQQYTDPFLTGRTYVGTVGDTTHVAVTDTNTSDWLVDDSTIYITVGDTIYTRTVDSFVAGVLEIDSPISDWSAGDPISMGGEYYGIFP